MKISVYDTYVPIDNKLMHFDILTEENDTLKNVFKYGNSYLQSKGLSNYKLKTEECKFCHIEVAPRHIEKEIEKKGYFIIEMENC